MACIVFDPRCLKRLVELGWGGHAFLTCMFFYVLVEFGGAQLVNLHVLVRVGRLRRKRAHSLLTCMFFYVLLGLGRGRGLSTCMFLCVLLELGGVAQFVNMYVLKATDQCNCIEEHTC